MGQKWGNRKTNMPKMTRRPCLLGARADKAYNVMQCNVMSGIKAKVKSTVSLCITVSERVLLKGYETAPDTILSQFFSASEVITILFSAVIDFMQSPKQNEHQ